jgi:hypothetical protein
MNTNQSISDRAHQEGWTSHQRVGAIAQDLANINLGVEHNHVTNALKRGDKSHVTTLSQMFQALAQKVKDAAVAEINVNEANDSNQHSILKNLQLAEEHLVFKFSSIDSRVKCSEIVASVNVTKIMSRVITSVIIALFIANGWFGGWDGNKLYCIA